jgi:ABC-type arginine transport system permease subunit
MKMSSGMLCRVVTQKVTDVSEVLTAAIIALMMVAVSTYETSVNFYETTRRNIPETVIFILQYYSRPGKKSSKLYEAKYGGPA